MSLITHQEGRPEAMADVPGACGVPLTRAIVQYRDVHQLDTPGGRIRDIGLALVLEGRYASSAEAIDLGSGDVKLLDLSQELVVLDWAYEPTLDHVTHLVRLAAEGDSRGELEQFCFEVGLQVLERLGFTPLTRPALLRLGFRDVCRDLDLHEGTSVRVVMGGGRMFRIHMDYEGNALVVQTPTSPRDGVLEESLAMAFPESDIRRIVTASEAAVGGYQVRFPLPQTLEELRAELALVRGGLLRLLGRFEPDRVKELERVVSTFGSRETLARLRSSRVEPRAERVPSLAIRPSTVH